MLNRGEKQEIINDLNEKFKSTTSLFVLEYKGLSVRELEGLRKDLKGVKAELKIVKNTLLKKASEKTDVDQINDLFVGPTAISICEKDSSAVAKIFVKSAKSFEHLKIKGGIVEGKVVDTSEIEQISRLPSRDELIAQFMGLLLTPLTNLTNSLNQIQAKLVYALTALKDKKDSK